MSGIPRLATGDIHPSMRLAAVVDVETTGFSPQHDAVIEAAITLFAFHSTEYQVLGIVDEYVGLQATDIPSSPRALAVHRISEADTFGQAIDRSRLSAMIDRAELMIAHNASFDRAFLRQLVADQVDSKPWLCAMRGIDWPGYGHESRRLGRLLRAHGIIPTVEHRAGGDVTGTLQLLAMTNASSRTYLWDLVEQKTAPGKLKIRQPAKGTAEPATGGQLLGQTVVVTGTMAHWDREEIEDLIEALGGNATSSVSRRTTLVVAGPGAGSKFAKAVELGIKVITEAEFIALISGKGAIGA
jgi:DNA polymerase-3 subunit epsilon